MPCQFACRKLAGGLPGVLAAASHSDTDRGSGKASREFRACGGGLAIPGNRSGPGNRPRRIWRGAHPLVVADLAGHAAPVPSAECGGGVPPERVTSRPPRVGGAAHSLSPRWPRRHPAPSGDGRRCPERTAESIRLVTVRMGTPGRMWIKGAARLQNVRFPCAVRPGRRLGGGSSAATPLVAGGFKWVCTAGNRPTAPVPALGFSKPDGLCSRNRLTSRWQALWPSRMPRTRRNGSRSEGRRWCVALSQRFLGSACISAWW